MVRKKTLSELEKAEIKLESLMEKRGVLNQEAGILRQERDLVHDRKREVSAQLRVLRDRRAALVGEAKAHRRARDEFQAKAKALIEVRRKLRSPRGRSASEELRNVRRTIREMEHRQQTESLSLSDENRLLVVLKGKMSQAAQLEVLKGEEEKVAKEVSDLDAAITEFFASADREHGAAVERSDAARGLDGEMDGLHETLATLGREGDAKHEAYLEAKAKADEIHAKVVEMRAKVLAERGARRAEAREAWDLIRRQNRAVRDMLLDEKRLEESADEALAALLKKGRVEIGR